MLNKIRTINNYSLVTSYIILVPAIAVLISRILLDNNVAQAINIICIIGVFNLVNTYIMLKLNK